MSDVTTGQDNDGDVTEAFETPPNHHINPEVLQNILVAIKVEVGRTKMKIRDLLRLTRDAVLPLDRRVEDPVELWVGDRLIARGELEELGGDSSGQLAVRLTEVANLRGGL